MNLSASRLGLTSLTRVTIAVLTYAASLTSGAEAGQSKIDVGVTCSIYFPEEDMAGNPRELGDEPRGPLIDAFKQIFEGAGLVLNPAPVTPWSRATVAAARGERDGLAIALRTPAREETMVFVGPVFDRKWSVFRAVDAPQSASRETGVPALFQNLDPVKTGIQKSGNTPVFMPFPRLIRMIEEGRLSRVFGPDWELKQWSQQSGIAIEVEPDTTVMIPTYMALHKASPCASHQKELQESVAKWVEGGGRDPF